MIENYNFGAYLNELLIIKNVDKKHFAESMNISRSLLYRFLSSEQLPDKDQLEEIAEKLYLRLTEKNKLIESYECTKYGWEIVTGRKLITDMLIKLNNRAHGEDITYAFSLKRDFPLEEGEGIVTFTGKESVTKVILTLIDSVRHNAMINNVNVLMQPDTEGFTNILSQGLREISRNEREVSIKHVIRFKDTLIKRNSLYNLDILSYVLPLSSYEKLYSVYYGTDNVSLATYETFFPNYIGLDSNIAFVFSPDFESGILYTSKFEPVIELLNKEFRKILKDCLPLFVNLETYEKQSLYMFGYEQMIQVDTSLLHPENGIYTFPIDIIHKKVAEQRLPKEFGQLLSKRIELFKKRLEKSKALEIISLDGLQEFAKNGRLLIQRNIEFSVSERIKILENLLNFVVNEDNYTLCLMKEGNPFYKSDMAVYVIGSELLYIVPAYTDFKISDNLIIRNKSIVESFSDFLNSSFTTQNSIVEKDEVIKIIKNILGKLEPLAK
jgi:transcriptional regulator with XRE-family HTH domain